MWSFVTDHKTPLTKFKVLSLVFQVRRDAFQQHVKTSMEKHLDLACAKLKEDRNKLKQLEVGCSRLNCVPYIWKISHFGKIQQEAKQGKVTRISSEPFFTSPQGYKMKMGIYPNGNKDGEGSHLSVYMHVMKGEYDSILSWPFQQKFKFTLVDQRQEEGNRKDLSRSITPHPPSREGFRRPVQEVSGGLGYPKFVSLEFLQSRRYIDDDTIFLKIEVC